MEVPRLTCQILELRNVAERFEEELNATLVEVVQEFFSARIVFAPTQQLDPNNGLFIHDQQTTPGQGNWETLTFGSGPSFCGISNHTFNASPT